MSQDHIQVFPPGSTQYQKLQQFTERLNNNRENPILYKIENTWFDYDQDWRWTTIIAVDTTQSPDSILSSWQALNPADQETILEGAPEGLDFVYKKIKDKESR